MPELELVRRIAPGLVAPSDEARAQARGALLRHIRRSELLRSRNRRLRWLAPAAGLAATAAAASAVFVGLGTDGEERASAAPAVLRKAAAAARAQPGPGRVEPGEYRYTKSVNAYLATRVIRGGGFSVLLPHVSEIWLGREGGRLRETTGTPQFMSERDRRRWVAAGRPVLGGGTSTTPLPPSPPLGLPSDADALYARIKRDAAGHGDGLYEQMFTLVGDALRETGASPAQRAALYEVAARIPGVELVGRVRDRAGRPGIAVAFSSDADKQRHVLIFDEATAALLGEEYVALAGYWNDYPEGTVVGYATYLTSGVVDSLGERPGARGGRR